MHDPQRATSACGRPTVARAGETAKNRKGTLAGPTLGETLSVAPNRPAKAEAGSSGGRLPRTAQRGEQALKGKEPQERRSSRPVPANAKGFDGRA